MAENRRSPHRAVRVAIVDDFRLVMDGLQARLADKEFDIDVVALSDTWDGLVSHPEFPPEVTVLDLHLGDTISIGAKIQTLRAAGSEVVVISRHADPATVARAMDAGALGYIPKTEGIAELVAAIAAAARGERYLSGALEDSIVGMNVPPAPKLGSQERRALALFAAGRSIRDVAGEMATTEETVKSYITRARRKYRDVGVELGTRALLRNHGIREGWLDPD
jgi:DNA-binding NarL/FixJ family response regulator